MSWPRFLLSHVSCYPLTLRFPCKPPILYFKGLVCVHWSLPGGSSGKPSCQCRRHKFDPWVGKIPWRRNWQPTPVFFPGKSHGHRSLAGYSPWGHRVRHNWSDLAGTQNKNITESLGFSASLAHYLSLPFFPRIIFLTAFHPLKVRKALI